MTNAAVIRRLRTASAEMARTGGNLYRVRAYRQAAFRLSDVAMPFADLGPAGLKDLGLGDHLANLVYQWSLDAVEEPITSPPF